MKTWPLRPFTWLTVVTLALSPAIACAAEPQAKPHNVILFVADGLRSKAVTPESAPTMAAVRARGVDFRNSHSLYPTITTVNASAIATGHGIGDTGDFGNSIYTGRPLPSRKGAPVAPLENDVVLQELNTRYGGSYLGASTLLSVARQAGYSVAVIGKLGPAAIQAGGDPGVLVIDDDTGPGSPFPVPADLAAAVSAAGLPPGPPSRADNAFAGDATHPGTLKSNAVQQDWFAAVATRVLLPRFKEADKPFVLVFWSRDPDGSQHDQGDSLGTLEPGINGPTSKAGIRNADTDLARLQEAVNGLGLAATTDIILTADHGFSTVAKDSASVSATAHYPGIPAGQLPTGFMALDLGRALQMPVFDAPDGRALDLQRDHPGRGYSLIGPDPTHPQIVIAGNGASNLVYLIGASRRMLARRVATALLGQDYTSALFVDDALGAVPGTLPLSAVGLTGIAKTPRPSMVVSFRNRDLGCGELCQADVADVPLQVGQGIHGSLGRGDTHNFMAAIGPDFRRGFVDPAPVSNADLAPTMAHILGLALPAGGRLRGRNLSEALAAGKPVKVRTRVIRSRPWRDLQTILQVQEVGSERYVDAGGIVGRSLPAEPSRPALK